MGEFSGSGDQPASACSKGDDLLAMMDGLWRGYPAEMTQEAVLLRESMLQRLAINSGYYR